VLEEPKRYDLPCLWPEPIPVDRVLPLGTPFSWREYELTAHEFSGHTRYAAAISFEVDGRRVLATGDQYTPRVLNYQYRNRFRRRDFVRSAELLRELRPDVLIGGHFSPLEVTDEYLDTLLADGERIARLHDELLPEEGFGEDGFGARIEPYRSTVAAGAGLDLDVTVRNPFGRAETASVRMVVPDGWTAEPEVGEVELPPHGEGVARFRVSARRRVRRARVAADLTVGDVPFGQQAEALVDVE
jgi:glyoxylase-like metal-dependent hydrolase (beta-lactamase superfamily II)